MTMKKLLPLILCSPLLLTAYNGPASDSVSESAADIFTIELDASKPGNQVLEIDGRYRVEIRDESGDQRPDHWELYVDGVLRCRRWSSLGYGRPSAGEIYDAEGNLVGKIVTKY